MNNNGIFISQESMEIFYEKTAVKKTANHIGFGILLFFLISNVVTILISAVLGFLNPKLLSDSAIVCLLNIAITIPAILISSFFILGKQGKKAGEIISFSPPKRDKFLPAIMVGMGFCYVANLATSLLQSALSGIITLKNPAEPVLPSGPFGFLLSVLSMAVFPAILEEFLFRGVIMGSLLKFGKPFAIFVSSFLFGLVHQNLVQIPFAFLVGLVLAFIVLETGSIWTGILVHFLNNFIATLLQILTNKYSENVVNAWYLIFLASMIMLGFFGFYLLSQKNKNLFSFTKTLHKSTSAQRFKWLCSSATIVIVFVFVGITVVLVQLLG